jgi:hypothetical protein
MSYHITKDGKILSSDQQGILIPDDTDRTPLVEWLRDHINSIFFATTGSTAFFGSGNDTDFLINIEEIPANIRHLVPPPLLDSEYDSTATILHDDFHPTDGNVDYIIGSPERTQEFEFATRHFTSIRRDDNTPAEVWNLLRTNKALRIAIFRALRHAAPNSSLTY